ncbi:hypothetical protein V8C34DRAFT_186676 [Trichoderma compactum]
MNPLDRLGVHQVFRSPDGPFVGWTKHYQLLAIISRLSTIALGVDLWSTNQGLPRANWVSTQAERKRSGTTTEIPCSLVPCKSNQAAEGLGEGWLFYQVIPSFGVDLVAIGKGGAKNHWLTGHFAIPLTLSNPPKIRRRAVVVDSLCRLTAAVSVSEHHGWVLRSLRCRKLCMAGNRVESADCSLCSGVEGKLQFTPYDILVHGESCKAGVS